MSMHKSPKKKPRSENSGSTQGKNSSANNEYVFCKEYIHYKTGKVMKASDYGYDCWKFLKKKGA